MDYFTQKKYLEFKVLKFDKDGKPEKKEATAKGSVMISDKDADVLNRMAVNTKICYELAPEPKQAKPPKDEPKP
jgi:hypothetical protein